MSEVESVKRGPGRPSKSELKKGNPSWMPANVSEVTNKDPDYHYRWCRKDKDNLAKKKLEGWEVVSGVAGDQTQAENGQGRINDGQKLTSVQERSDAILMRLPNELADSRSDYFRNETARRTQGLTAHLKEGLRKEGGGAPVHGNITISSRQGTQVIE